MNKEEGEVVNMYYYYNQKGEQLWTSNETFAFKRAQKYKSEIFMIRIPKSQQNGQG